MAQGKSKTGKNRQQRNRKTNGGVDDRECFNCGGVGHLLRDCTSVVKCLNCGVLGHIVNDCPMKTGEVVNFYGGKGFGFIRPDGDEEDLFFHQSEIQSDGYRTLRKGQGVRFSIAETKGRMTAVKVTPVDNIL